MDLTNMDSAELRILEKDVEAAIKNRSRHEIDAARNEIYAIAHRMGLPLQSVLGDGLLTRKAKVAARYRNPQNSSEEWTGRGRQPKWVQKMIAAGASIECARI